MSGFWEENGSKSMGIRHLIIEQERKKREQEDNQRPALRIPALDPSSFPPPAPSEKPRSDRGVHITPGYDDDDEETGGRVVIRNNNLPGYTF
jgi:hypothetical protein